MDIVTSFLLLPIALGLLGFVEPCSVGASLLFLKSTEGNARRIKLLQAGVFALTRIGFAGALGAIAALVGAVFITFQRLGFIVLGVVYVALGAVYLLGYADRLMRGLGPNLSRLSTVRGSAALAAFFGLNIPACATPLLVGVLGAAAIAGPAKMAEGFFSLALFGLGLSLPLFIALMFERGRRAIEWLGRYSARVPGVIGVLFLALGGWTIWAGAVAAWAPK